MSDIPVIFSGPMILALLAGRKTMTRRLAWHEPTPKVAHTGKAPKRARPLSLATAWQRVKPGDRLWVRENLAVVANWGVFYAASGPPTDGRFIDDIDERGRALLERYGDHYNASDEKRVPSIHMPRWASRLTLEVTATKVERLQRISYGDVIAEGCPAIDAAHSGGGPEPHHVWVEPGKYISCRLWYHRLWDELHGPGAWDANPEVVAVTYAVHRCNIDAMERQAA